MSSYRPGMQRKQSLSLLLDKRTALSPPCFAVSADISAAILLLSLHATGTLSQPPAAKTPHHLQRLARSSTEHSLTCQVMAMMHALCPLLMSMLLLRPFLVRPRTFQRPAILQRSWPMECGPRGPLMQATDK